jgi:AcrR family transcriptional regulator
MTRARAIVAAIDVLFDAGHAAATTVEVAKRAKISRGALLHQFPTRNSLLIAVAQHIIAEQSRYRRERIATASTGKGRYYAAIEAGWEVQKQPLAIAMLEIMMAARNDPSLREAFTIVTQSGNQIRRDAARFAASDLGVTDLDTMDDMLLLHASMLRGLAMQLLLGQTPESVERVRQLFMSYERMFAADLLSKQRATP